MDVCTNRFNSQPRLKDCGESCYFQWPGERRLLLGNEAIARGALEAGISAATAYPGTPSTEIVESLAEVARDYGVYVEWSTNEKVALEVGMCVSMMGLRALVAMKHVGLNVASDLS